MPGGVIFDVDGTLIDSNDAHASAWLDALKEFGFSEVGYESIRKMIGMGGDKILPDLTGLAGNDERGKKHVEAAKGAGVPIIAVRCGGWGDRELKGALALYDDPADILSNFDTSHFANIR